MSTDTLKRRYFYKLSANLVGTLIGLVSGAMIPRALGVNNFGNYNFTLALITELFSFLELRSSTCFYIKLSQRPNENKLVLFYGLITGGLFFILFFSVICITFSPLRESIFQGQSSALILYSVILVIVSWVPEIFVKILDAHGATVRLEKIRTINRLLGIILLVTLYASNHLNLNSYFYYQYIMVFLLLILLTKFAIKHKYLKYEGFLSKIEFLSYCKEFYKYIRPLAIYVILSFGIVSIERWLLQYYGGSYQQGLYSFAFSLSFFFTVFTSAMTPIFTRELSVAVRENDLQLMGSLFRKYVPFLYAITAYFSCFIFVESEAIIGLFGGKDYQGADISVKILAFYPLVALYGNLNGSVLYASAKTKIFAKLLLFIGPLSVIMTYTLISNENWGLNLGATGYALKMVMMELISVLIILYMITQFLKLSFKKYFSHLFLSVVPFIIAAFISHFSIQGLFRLLNISQNLIPMFLLSGLLYTIFAAVIAWALPLVFGMSRSDMSSMLNAYLIQWGLKS